MDSTIDYAYHDISWLLDKKANSNQYKSVMVNIYWKNYSSNYYMPTITAKYYEKI